MRKPRSKKPTVEQLEGRVVLTGGNVTVAVSAGVLRITGDGAGNRIQITGDADGQIQISPLDLDSGATRINHRTSVTIAATKDVRISMGGGKDWVEIVGSPGSPVSFPGSLSVSMGDNLDTFHMGNGFVQDGLTITMGSNISALSYHEGAVVDQSEVGSVSYTTNRSDGSNSFNLTSAKVRGNVSVTGSGGSNSVSIASTRISGTVTASLGDEPNNSSKSDHFSMTASTVGKKLWVNMGSGRGSVDLSNDDVATLTVQFGGYSGDGLQIINTIAGESTFDGGGGNRDSIFGSGNTFKKRPVIRNFEEVTLT